MRFLPPRGCESPSQIRRNGASYPAMFMLLWDGSDLIYCCRHETERRSQSLRHNGLCHAGSRHPCRVNSDGWGSRYRFTAPRFSTTIRCCCFQVIRAAFGRFMRRSRIPKHSCRHIYSRCEVRSCGAGQTSEARQPKAARARTLGVNMLSENAFKEMPTLADKSSDFGFTSGIQVYFWTQRRRKSRLPQSSLDAV